MMDQNRQFKELLEKFKFTEPVSGPHQAHMLAVKRKILINILKQKNAYNFFLGASLRVFFIAKSVGIRLSIIQSAAAASILSIAIASVAAAGSYVAVKKIVSHEKPPVQIEEKRTKEIKEESPDQPEETGNIQEDIAPRDNEEEKNNTNNTKINFTDNENHARKNYKKTNIENTETPEQVSNKDRVIQEDKELNISEVKMKDEDTEELPQPGEALAENSPRTFKFYISADAGLALPLGYLKNICRTGLTGNLSFGLKDLFTKNLLFGLESGLSSFPDNSDNSNSGLILPLNLFASYYFINGKYYLAPRIGVGVAAYSIKKEDNSREEDLAGLLNAGTEAGYFPLPFLNIYAGITLNNILRKQDALTFISFKIGAGLTF